MTLVKKLGAIALGSILLGASLGVGLGQLTVKDAIQKLGAPGTDFWVVIGRDAKVEDVLAGIDIVARFAEFAATEKTLAGTTQYTVKGWEARLPLDSNSLNASGAAPGVLTRFDKNVLPQLKELVVRNGTLTVTGVQEYLVMNYNNLSLPVYGNTTLTLPFGTNQYFTYYVDLSGKKIYANILEGKLVRVKVAGKDVVVSDTSRSNTIKVLSGFGPEWVNVGDVKNVEGTPYKVRVDNVVGFGSDAIVQVSVIDQNGNAYPLALYPGQYDIEPTTGVKVVVLRAFGYGDTKMAYLVAGVEEEITNGKRIDNLFQWYVNASGGYLEGIGYQFSPNETVYLDVGKSIIFPNNYLKLTNLGLSLTDKDYLATIKLRVVDVDANKVTGLTGTANSTAIEVSGVPLYTSTKAYDKVYVVLSATAQRATIAELNATGYYVPIQGNLTLGPTGLTLSVAPVDNVGVRVNVGVAVTFDAAGKKVSSVQGSGDYALRLDPVNNNNTYVYTAYGHKVFVTSDGKELRFYWTPIKGYLRVVLGEVTQQVVGGGKYKELDVTKLSVPVAKFDDEVPTDASLTKNLVVVGGPYVNRVAAALLNIPYKAGDQITAYYKSLGAMNKGLVKVFDNVFGSGKVALLVAGWRAEDTRLTASVLQQYDKFLAQLAQGDTLVIGGTVESPTITAPQTGATQ